MTLSILRGGFLLAALHCNLFTSVGLGFIPTTRGINFRDNKHKISQEKFLKGTQITQRKLYFAFLAVVVVFVLDITAHQASNITTVDSSHKNDIIYIKEKIITTSDVTASLDSSRTYWSSTNTDFLFS